MRRIFIIGPMSDATGEPLQNIGIIEDALKIILRDHNGEPVRIDVPQKKYGSDIPDDVFSAIDMSDLVIADISHRSPNVMYELAFAHALGTPTILIDMPEPRRPSADFLRRFVNVRLPPKNIFYLTQNRRIEPKLSSSDAIAAELKPSIESWLKKESNLTENPLTKFYKLPLVDISAVTGIAIGYAENFIVPLITAIQGPIEQRHDGKPVVRPRYIVVVLPDTLDNLRQEEIAVEVALDDAFPGSLLLFKKLTAQTSKGPRTVPYYVGGVFVDIPRTLIPLRRSRRMERLLSSNPADAEFMERKLIKVFGEILLQEAKKSGEIAKDLLHVVERKDLLKKLNALVETRRE
jgi:hypothetical protein